MHTARSIVRRLLACLLLSGLLSPVLVADAARQEVCFAETGFCVQGRFLDYWQQNGGLARNGFPLSAERRGVLENGNAETVLILNRPGPLGAEEH